MPRLPRRLPLTFADKSEFDDRRRLPPLAYPLTLLSGGSIAVRSTAGEGIFGLMVDVVPIAGVAPSQIARH